MRLGRLLAILVCAALRLPPPNVAYSAEQEFPYTAYVERDGALLRSGPGKDSYATDRALRGQAIEIHRRDDDGWLAIRPPAGSFSWVKAKDLRVGSDGIGIVLSPNTPCRAGSNLGPWHDSIQVRLDRGEEVEVLDTLQKDSGADDKPEKWCMIAPPSGEFRYVEASDVVRDPPDEPSFARQPPRAGSSDRNKPAPRAAEPTLASSLDPSGDDEALAPPPTRPSSASSAPNPPPTESKRPSRLSEWDPPSGDQAVRLAAAETPAWTASKRPLGRSRPSSNLLDRPSNLPDRPAGRPSNRAAEPLPAARDLPSERPPPAPSSPGQALQQELDALDLAIAEQLLRDARDWNLNELSTRADRLLDHADTALERGKVRLVQTKLRRLEDLRARQLGLSADPAAQSSPHARAPAASTPNADEQKDRYDGVGKLTPVKSKRPNAPRYALVNGQNDVVSFVTPAPGVNLQPYEGQYVGILGQRGFMPELKKPHLTAQRISPVGQRSTDPVLGARDRLPRR